MESEEREKIWRGKKLDELYEEIVSRTASQRRVNSIGNLYKTLLHLLTVKSNATSVASIAQAVSSLGYTSPKAQSIRNVEGKDFRDLIGAYIAVSDNGKSQDVSDDDRLVGGIDDLRVAAQVRWLLNENRSLKRRLDLLHAAYQNLEPMKVIGAALSDNEFDNGKEFGFTKIEIEAVGQFLTNLSDIHCGIDDASGALLYKGNLEVAPPGFGQALAKLTEFTN